MSELKNGVMLKYADIIFGKYFIYVLTPQNILYPCVIYNFSLSESEYKNNSKPEIHFCNCKDLWSIYDRDFTRLKVKIPQNNSFDFQIGLDKNTSSKLFYDIELPVCKTCISVYEMIFLRFNITPKLELWNLLFANRRILRLEKVAIEDSINVNMHFTLMDVHIGDKYFYLTRKKDGIFEQY